MIPRILSIVTPLVAYFTLWFVIRGVYRERAKLDRWTLALAGFALIASLAFRPFEHLLLFDEDIYTNIASNLAHAPIAQLTLYGNIGDSLVSTYYKEPAGYPVLLSLIFLVTGTREIIAFVFVRVLFAVSVAAVYQLAREIIDSRMRCVAAAILFAATPVVFAYSASAGTDIAAVLFATLGVWGVIAGNGMLAAAGLAYAAQVRMELIVLLPLLVLSRKLVLRWKLIGLGLIAAQIIHIGWVLSVAPQLAKAEHVQAAFSFGYIRQNLAANVRYLLDPFLFPALVATFAAIAVFRRTPFRMVCLYWLASLSAVYLIFYAGSFDLNPRYSIALTVPLIVLAVSSSQRKIVPAVLVVSLVACNLHPYTLPPYVQTLVADHQVATSFARNLDRNTLVITTEPEEFMNSGVYAMNAIYAAEQPGKLKTEMAKFKQVVYYAGVRTLQEGSLEERADRWVKSNLQLHLIDSRTISGMRIAYYKLTAIE